jgi:pimeloyl-ACP methyl ester carboxylesterase
MYPVLLLHGALGSQHQLMPLAEALETENFSTLTINFSGHGGTPLNSEFGIESFGDEVVNHLKAAGIPSVDVFGYSMGGYVAAWLALRHPALIHRVVTLGTKFDWDPHSAAREVRKLDPDKILEKVPAFAAILRKRHHPTDWRVLLQKTSAMMLGLGNTPLLTQADLAAIAQEVLVLLGDADDMADRDYSARVAASLPSGKFILLDDTPHPIERVKLEVLVPVLREFFAH